LSKVPAPERLPRALAWAIETARHDFPDLRSGKVEIVQEGVRRIWYEPRLMLPGATQCRVEYRDDIYRCEWQAASAENAERIWQEVNRAAAEVLSPPFNRAVETEAMVAYEAPAQPLAAALRVEIRRVKARRGIILSVARH
jgi:hypothetical protein